MSTGIDPPQRCLSTDSAHHTCRLLRALGNKWVPWSIRMMLSTHPKGPPPCCKHLRLHARELDPASGDGARRQPDHPQQIPNFVGFFFCRWDVQEATVPAASEGNRNPLRRLEASSRARKRRPGARVPVYGTVPTCRAVAGYGPL